MKIILISIGTRGDMEPFLAIGDILKGNGHHVIAAFPEQFRKLADESDIEFASLGEKFIELLNSEVGKLALGGTGTGLKKFIAYIKLAAKQNKANKELLTKQYKVVVKEKPDRIVYNGKSIYPIIWELNNQGKSILICPLPYMHYVKDHTHVVFNSNFGAYLNKLTYSLANFGLVTTVMISKKWLNIKRKITRKQIKNILSSNKAIYTISPSLFSRPNYWDKNLKVLGYNYRSKNANWHPDEDLNKFLEKHNRILFITFGSMTNPEPEEKTKLFIEILERNNIPAIINTASGGLVKLKNYNSGLIHFVEQIPYEFIFPKMYGIIHHGGSGTTHLGLKNGCATLIIPHIIDQFVWNNIVSNLGVGPKGIKINKITAANLESKILELVNNSSFKEKAEEIANKMRKENLQKELYETIIE